MILCIWVYFHTRCPRHPAITAAAMQVELPLRDGSGAAPMETDENDSGGRGGSSDGSGGEGSGGREQVPRLDFGALPQELRKRNKKADTQFREQIDEKTAELERLAPNLKVRHPLRISAGWCSNMDACTW